MGLVRLGPPSELVLYFRDKYGLRDFIETGTYYGDTAVWAASCFDRVITIEYSREIYKETVDRYGKIKNIDFIFGDSRSELKTIVSKLDRPAIFWLDSHWSGENTYGEDDQCPLIEEIRTINISKYPNFLFIDDARLFTSPLPPFHKREEWPSINEIFETLKSGNYKCYVDLAEDVIIAVPDYAKEPLASYCQKKNTEMWEEYINRRSHRRRQQATNVSTSNPETDMLTQLYDISLAKAANPLGLHLEGEDMISVIVFSKDRPLQLLAYLESLQYYSGLKEDCIHILYKSTGAISYGGLRERYPQIHWVLEEDFRGDLKDLLRKAKDYILWGCDDVFFKSAFNINTCINALKSNKELFAFSLRLGKNIRPHQELSKEDGYFVWDWTLAKDIPWNYPWEVSGSIYRKRDILEYLEFSDKILSPNYLESEIARYFKEHRDSDKKYIACFEFSKCLTLTINRVQETHPNEFDGTQNTDPAALYNAFSCGYKLDWYRFKDCHNKKTHVGSGYYALELEHANGAVKTDVEKRSKKFTSDKLRILVFKPDSGIGSYILHDCIDVLKELSHEVEILLHKGPRSVSEERLIGRISNFQPDFILAYDHTGIRTKLLTQLKIPYASYFSEPPEFWWLGYEPIDRSISPYCVLFMWDKSRVRAFKTIGFEHVYFLPLAANPERFQGIILEGNREEYSCEVSFAGNPLSRETCPELFNSLYDGIDKCPEAGPILEGAINMIAQNPYLEVSDILEVLQEVQQGYRLSFKDQVHREMVELGIRYEAMTLSRKRVLEWTADLGLKLYGEHGWERILGDDVKYMGNLSNWELPKLYSASKINLNVTNTTILEGLPMRAFDVPGSGGFLLTDYRPILGEFFDIGKEVVCYNDKEDLREKIKYYLAHPEERQEIARQGQERVLKEHTYRHRMEKLVNIMREIFG